MFSWPVRNDEAPRWKNGHPAHITTAVERASWIQIDHCAGTSFPRPSPGIWPPISMMNTGRVSVTPIQKRLDMLASSGFGAAATVIVTGSNAIPQMGQLPMPAWRICECIGQV